MARKGWWSLGDHSGYRGDELALYQIECGFCEEKGNFELEKHFERKSKEKDKALNYDVYRCVGRGNLTMVFWSAGRDMHDYRQVPWPQNTTSFPQHWPDEIGRNWLEAQRSIENPNWGAAAVMARSALQLLLRHEKAVGGTLVKEIDDLATKGLIHRAEVGAQFASGR